MPKGIYNRKNASPPMIFVARESFTTVFNGSPISVLKGVTVRDGHPLLAGREMYFNPQKVDYELEFEDEPDLEPDLEPTVASSFKAK